MELSAILAALETSCDGKQGSEDVQVPAELLLAAQQELKAKAQMAKDLEMARDEASMKPSVARKLNEKIRALEAELEELRSNKKVKELEKKVQFLEHELKQSYTTKNFTLKSGLLELEKQYRPHMNVDPDMAAFWDDITVLLDEKKERDAHFSQPKGPRMTAPSAVADASRARTPRISASESSAGAAPAAAGAAVSASGAEASPSKEGPTPPSTAFKGSELEQSSSTAVQMQVDTFNTIISEEAASAATLPADVGSSKQGSEELVVRHGAGFRVVRPVGMADPQADAAAADSSASAGAAAGSAAAAGAAGHQEQQQSVALLRHDFASRVKDVTFHAMPASKQPSAPPNAAAAVPTALEQPTAAQAVKQQTEAVSSSLQDILQHFGSLAAGATTLPMPPELAGSSTGQQQQLSGEVDTASLWQHQLQQLLESAQQLQQQHAEGGRSAAVLRQQEAAANSLLGSVSRMQAVLQAVSSSGDAESQQAVAAALVALAGLKQELQLLLRSLQRAVAEAGGQCMLVAVFGEFLSQLEQQGVLSPAAAAAAAAAASSDQQQQGEQQPVMLSLLQEFLHANPQVPQMLAVELAPAVPAKQQQEDEQPAVLAVELSSTAVQAVADGEDQEVQAVAEAEHREVQCEPAGGQHAETQCETAEGQHTGTQSDPLPMMPSDHIQTQTEAAGPSEAAGTQTEFLQPDTTHVSTQAAAEAVSAEVQTSSPRPVAAAMQAELRPEMSEAGSQADLPAAAVAAADGRPVPSSTGSQAAAAGGAAILDESQQITDSRKDGSGIIYSASGSELSVEKAAVGQQLDILHRIQRSRAGDPSVEGEGEGGPGAAVADVKPEDLTDLRAVANELGQLRADNLELAASLQVTQSLVDHLNTNLKAAVDKADDAEAEAAQVKQQLDKTVAGLEQLQSEHADLTHVLIEAKVELAEKQGELLKLVREIKRWRSEASEQNAAGVVNQLENILAVVPSAGDDSDVPQSPASATAASRQSSSFDAARQGGLAGLAAGLGHMREAWGGLGVAGRARTARVSDSSGPAAAAGAAGAEGGAAAAASGAAALPRSSSEKK